MTNRSVSLIAVVVAFAGCESDKERAYRALAAELNPILAGMQRTAAAVLDPPDTDYDAIVQACSGADEFVRALASAKSVSIDSIVGRHGSTSLQLDARALLRDRGRLCSGDASNIRQVCSSFCRSWWRGLAAEVEQLRTAAHALDVTLTPVHP